MKRITKNSNEKSERNQNIFKDRENGLMVVELSNKYGISIPRVHRVCMQEENKFLKADNERLRSELNSCLNQK